jgi:hypothetical protein
MVTQCTRRDTRRYAVHDPVRTPFANPPQHRDLHFIQGRPLSHIVSVSESELLPKRWPPRTRAAGDYPSVTPQPYLPLRAALRAAPLFAIDEKLIRECLDPLQAADALFEQAPVCTD